MSHTEDFAEGTSGFGGRSLVFKPEYTLLSVLGLSSWSGVLDEVRDSAYTLMVLEQPGPSFMAFSMLDKTFVFVAGRVLLLASPLVVSTV